MMKRKSFFIIVFSVLLSLMFLGCEGLNDDLLNNSNQGGNTNGGTKPATPDMPALIATGGASDVGFSSVKLWGRLNTDTLISFFNVRWGVEYSTDKDAILSHSAQRKLCTTDLVGENADEFSVYLSGVGYGQQLYYNAYLLINNIKYIYGELDSVQMLVKLSAMPSDNSYGRVTGSGYYEIGTKVSITASAKDSGYFVGWNDSDSKELTRTITLNSNTSVIAIFKKKPYLRVQSNNTSYGMVTGSGYYDIGTEVVITATPKTEYANFISWHDGNTDNPRTIMVNKDTTFTAVFKDETDGYHTVANAAFGTAYLDYAYTDLILANETDTLVISLNTEGEETLSVGEYTMDDSGEYPAGTWDPEYSYWYNAENGSHITDGTISVTKAGRNYTVKTDCVDENGDSVKWVYTGQVDLEVKAHEPAQSEFNLTWDNFDTNDTYYMYVNQYSLYAYALAIVDPETGWEIDLDFFGNATDTEGKLPTGTFTMLTSSITEYGILPGYVDDDGYTNGSYAINWDDPNSTFNPFVDGSFTITEADGNTTLEGSFTTESGDEVSVNVTGTTPTIELHNPSGVSAKKSIVAKQGKKLNKRFMRK